MTAWQLFPELPLWQRIPLWLACQVKLIMLLTAVGVLVFMLAGCQTMPKVPVLPKTVEVTVTKFVPVPDALAKDCDQIDKKNSTVGEAVRLANTRAAALEECTARMRKIRALGKP